MPLLGKYYYLYKQRNKNNVNLCSLKFKEQHSRTIQLLNYYEHKLVFNPDEAFVKLCFYKSIL